MASNGNRRCRRRRRRRRLHKFFVRFSFEQEILRIFFGILHEFKRAPAISPESLIILVTTEQSPCCSTCIL